MIVVILASKNSRRNVTGFWKHLAILVAKKPNIEWKIIYAEEEKDLVLDDTYIIVGCLTSTLLSEIITDQRLQSLVKNAKIIIPFVFSPCAWNQSPSPFQGKTLLVREILSQGDKDSVFYQAAEALWRVL